MAQVEKERGVEEIPQERVVDSPHSTSLGAQDGEGNRGGLDTEGGVEVSSKARKEETASEFDRDSAGEQNLSQQEVSVDAIGSDFAGDDVRDEDLIDNQLDNDNDVTKRSMEKISESSDAVLRNGDVGESGRDKLDGEQLNRSRLENEAVVSQDGLASRDFSVTGEKEPNTAPQQSRPHVHYGGLPEPTKPEGAVLLDDERYSAPASFPRESTTESGVRHGVPQGNTSEAIQNDEEHRKQRAPNSRENSQVETGGATSLYRGEDKEDHNVGGTHDGERHEKSGFLTKMATKLHLPGHHHNTQNTEGSPPSEVRDDGNVSGASSVYGDANKEESKVEGTHNVEEHENCPGFLSKIANKLHSPRQQHKTPITHDTFPSEDRNDNVMQQHDHNQSTPNNPGFTQAETENGSGATLTHGDESKGERRTEENLDTDRHEKVGFLSKIATKLHSPRNHNKTQNTENNHASDERNANTIVSDHVPA